MSTVSLMWFDAHKPRDLWRWVWAAAIVLAVHAGALAYYFASPKPPQLGGDTDVVTVELAPIDSTPDAAASDVAPAPETMVESKAEPQPQPEPQHEEVKAETPPEPSPAPIPEPVVKREQPVEVPKPPAPVTAQQVKGGAPRIEPSWQTSLVRQLQRFKRYPHDAQVRNQEGVVVLSFSLDRNGHVLTHHIARSSGVAALDEEVMAMIVRAEPLPAFPASMPQPQIELTVPVRFSLR